ncbi:hypothetical protein LG634_30230 [Streptomyces bambusae]|uniref:hypothetical protein n=1 Tax=Streptomyces bambusae TaxID=1550616 RepID=UPI001CFF721E|nr:hypothetical protein [Streptomyces bambusae]MCB5169077.1 hypothetical protein [Streptomyces bambusae]
MPHQPASAIRRPRAARRAAALAATALVLMSGGASGGPWPADFDRTTGKGVLVPVNSALDSLTPTRMYGEVFRATARKVYERAQRA